MRSRSQRLKGRLSSAEEFAKLQSFEPTFGHAPLDRMQIVAGEAPMHFLFVPAPDVTSTWLAERVTNVSSSNRACSRLCETFATQPIASASTKLAW
jgi:hypothetical protein